MLICSRIHKKSNYHQENKPQRTYNLKEKTALFLQGNDEAFLQLGEGKEKQNRTVSTLRPGGTKKIIRRPDHSGTSCHSEMGPNTAQCPPETQSRAGLRRGCPGGDRQ